MRKNDRVVAILMKTGFNNVFSAAHIVHSCQHYWTILLHPIQAQQYCSILLNSGLSVFSRVHGKKRRSRCLTGLNKVLLPTLFTLVNNIEQYC